MTIETLFRENFRPLTVYAMQFVKDKAAAEDVVQDLFVNLFEKKETFQSKTLSKSFLYRSVHNRCINHKKYQQVRKEMNPVIQESMNRIPEDPHQLSTFIEFQDKFLRVLEELSPKSRQVFEMSKMDGIRNQEIADSLKLSKRTVEKHIYLVLKRLRKKLLRYLDVIIILLSFYEISFTYGLGYSCYI
jgi:RNA polymerase sigma-70 factor (family 1)